MASRGGINVEIFGTKFTLALGGWRLRLVLALEDTDSLPAGRAQALEHEPVMNRGA
jgi:hypothetical protein